MSATISVRELVLDTLLQITRDGEFSHIALHNVLTKYQYIEKKERAFITRVVNGTLEHMIEIDYIINQFSNVKVNKLKPVIRTIIRSAVYQLIYMDSVPDSAVCNEAVKLAEKKGFRTLKGFVNGVLRNIGRKWESVEYPTGLINRLSVQYSLPLWILQDWLSVYDVSVVQEMAEAFLAENPVSVRYNLDRIGKEDILRMLEQEGVHVEVVPDVPHALFLSGYDFLGSLESFRRGYYQVQDVSSMQVAGWVDPQPGDYIIDVCASPGGKAIHVAEMLHGTGHIEARDLTDYKIALMKENIERSKLSNIEAKKQDALKLDEEACNRADIVIADLPCSGLGVLGKKPDLKYKMTKEAQQELTDLQRRILEVVHAYVKPGGKLVYSTCTINREENEENAKWFQTTHSEFRLIKEQQILPGKERGDGFYIALFQKEN